eukprot:6212098-Pleurochrysis_carterae.AAC.1
MCDGPATRFVPPRAALAPGDASHSPDVLCAATHNLQLCVMPRRTPRLGTALAFRDLWPLPFGHISHSYSRTAASQNVLLSVLCAHTGFASCQ